MTHTNNNRSSIMKKIISVVAASLALTLTLPAAANAVERTGASQVCVQDVDGLWYALLVETSEQWEEIADLRVEPFPNSAAGCAAYGEQKGAPELPAPVPTCEPVTHIVTKTVKVPVDVVRYVDRITTVVDTRRVDELTVELAVKSAKVDRQRTKIMQQRQAIKRLRAKLQRR